MLTKAKGVLAASVLALAAAGGSAAVTRAESAGAARPAAAGSPAAVASGSPAAAARVVAVGAGVTATVPSHGAADADGIQSDSIRSASRSGSGETGGAGSGVTGSAAVGSIGAGSGAQTSVSGSRGNVTGGAGSDRSRAASMLPRSAGQGEPGPLPAGALPVDGAVPGASPAVRALAAARRATTVLPHSPQLLAQLAGPTATAGVTTLAGLDVASHQHPVTTQYPNGTPINWQQVAAARYRFAAVKGTEGDYYVNPWAATDLAEAKAAGLDVAPYHFAIPNVSSGPEQAEYAVEYSGYAPGAQTLPLMLDIEYDPYAGSDGTNECYGLSATQMTNWIAGFVATARSLTGQYPIIYTTAGWWDACTGGSIAFGADPMWVAAYGVSSPPLPAGWMSYSYWQYTSVGTVPGVAAPGGTDLDSFSPSAVALIDPGPLAGRRLERVSFPLSSLGALAGEKLTWTASGLPPGLRVTDLGVLTGVIMNPSAGAEPGPVSYQPTVTAANTVGGLSSVTFDWQIVGTCPDSRPFGVCPGR